jgi:gluconokinase
MVFVIFGVSGAGKTTVGKLLADRLGCEFLDADDYHSVGNIEKMQRGVALDDADREGWLSALRMRISEVLSEDQTCVLACSALKAAYRKRLAVSGAVKFVYLRGGFDLIETRLSKRSGHFMPASLLKSQFEILEEPDSEEWTFDAGHSPEMIIELLMMKMDGDAGDEEGDTGDVTRDK